MARGGTSFVFRLLSRLFLALAALLALRIVFAAARRANRTAGVPADPNARRPDRARPATAAPPPRIDRGAAEDVPFVEMEPEPEHARRL